uniref:Uncharacterized protein n=1 Tax=Arracacha latent virus V TaxID=2057934 RepID=A0A3Q8EA12_9VIRU|nr:hypothetical protein [Arracacha latent virus V]
MTKVADSGVVLLKTFLRYHRYSTNEFLLLASIKGENLVDCHIRKRSELSVEELKKIAYAHYNSKVIDSTVTKIQGNNLNFTEAELETIIFVGPRITELASKTYVDNSRYVNYYGFYRAPDVEVNPVEQYAQRAFERAISERNSRV